MTRRIALAFATLAGVATTLVAAAPALAEGGSSRAAAVRVADLDLSTVAGQDELRDRISRAVRRVCSRPGDRTLDELVADGECRIAAKKAAMTRVTAMTQAATARSQLASARVR